MAWKKPQLGQGPDSEPGFALVLAPMEVDGGAEVVRDLQVGGGDGVDDGGEEGGDGGDGDDGDSVPHPG